MNKTLSQKQNNEFCILVCVICFLTNLSQMPFLVESSLTRYVSIPIWLLLGFVCFLKNRNFQIKRLSGCILLGLAFVLYYLVALFFNRSFSDSDLPYPIFLSLFVLLIGVLCGQFLSVSDIKQISNCYIWSGIMVCLNVYFTYVHGNSLDGPFYLYASKNSVSQILLTTWILILLFKFEGKSFWKKAAYMLAFVFLTWTMISLKSRASLIAMPLIMLWVIMHGKMNKKARNIIALILLAFVVLLFNEEFFDLIINDVLFRGKESGTMDDLTSGRSNEWATFFADFKDNSFLGAGREKRESLILTSLLEFGVIGGSVILSLACYPFVWALRHLNKNHRIFLVFTSIALVYTVNGIFEQLAPFGPGVKCYFLWFMMGFLSVSSDEELYHKVEHDTMVDRKYFKEKLHGRFK